MKHPATLNRRNLILSGAGVIASPCAFAKQDFPASGKSPGSSAPIAPVLRPYLLVPLKFADTQSISVPQSREYLNLITDPDYGADRYFMVSSNGRFSLAGSEAAEPFVLPKPADEYISHGAPWELTNAGWYSHQRLIDDIGPILEKKYDLSQFYGIIVFPNVKDKIGNGSANRPNYRKHGDDKPHPLPVIFINPGGPSLAGIVHEIGHHLDIGHVAVRGGAVKYDASGMSFVGAFIPQVRNVTCDEIMWHKELLGWTTPREVRTIDRPTDEVVRLYPRSGERNGLRMVKMPLEPFGEYITLEAVLPQGIDRAAGLPKFGVLAHRVNQFRVRRANLGLVAEVDFPEAQVSPSGTVCFVEGDEWSSADEAQAGFRVLKVTPNWCDVQISLKRPYEHVSNSKMKDAIQLEKCPFTVRGGRALVQSMKQFGPDWGGDAQLFGFGAVGEGIDIEFHSDQGGDQEVLLGYTLAKDFGIVDLQINNDEPIKLDEWASTLTISGQRSLGRHQILAGKNSLRLRITGQNQNWSGEHICYGLDCLSLRL